MSFPAPFHQFRGQVQPAWIDSNDHMNLAYYTVLFDQATDVIYDAFGIGFADDYKGRTKCGTMAAETHNLYVQELLVHEEVTVMSHVVAVDAKRLHLAHEMYRAADGALTAMQELMYLHVDLVARKVVPWPADVLAVLQGAAAAHATLKHPDWVGRRISMPAPKA